MAARTGVRCIFYCTSHLSRAFLPKYISPTMQPVRNHAIVNSLSYKIHNRNASTALKTEEAVSGCPICSRNLTFTYKDVLLLAQFISPEGHILNRRITGVCRKQQRKLEKAIQISRRLDLIPRKPPALIQKENQTT